MLRFGREAASVVVVVGLLWCTGAARAEQAQGYEFADAAQEITQLYWLADTADACGWASHEDAEQFKDFSVRFLGAHLSDRHKAALMSMVTQSGYEDQVRKAAQEGAPQNCESSRWYTGWTAYKAAADEHSEDF
jgi:hypothetical protein